MKTIKLLLLAVMFAIPMVVFAACGGDDTAQNGPQNQKDSSVVPDTSPTGDAGNADTSPGADSGPKYDPCANGVTFDNTRVPGYPNPPMP